MSVEQKDQPEDVQDVQADVTKHIVGKIRYFGKGIGNPTPTLLARVTKALRYFCTGLITMVSGSDLFTGGQAKLISFVLGLVILGLGGVDMFVGVEQQPAEKKST